MNILFTICGRAGSKGITGKNTQMFCGKPLVYYTIAAYTLCREYNTKDCIHLAVNTDSELLKKQIEQTGVEYFFIPRKESLAGDVVSKKDVIKDTLLECERMQNLSYDILVDLDITSPIRTAEDIMKTIDILNHNFDADIVYTVVESRRSPYFNMVSKKEDGYYTTVLKSQYVARQQAPVCYDMNASIYVYRRKYVLEGQMFERKALISVMDDTGVLDIDSSDDLELMQIIAEYLFANKIKYQNIVERVRGYEWDREHQQ